MCAAKYISNKDDEADGQIFAKPKGTIRKSSSVTGARPMSGKNDKTPIRKGSLSGSGAGALGEDDFRDSFMTGLPIIKNFNLREMQERMNNIQTLLSSTKGELWDKKCTALKELRSLVIQGATQFDEFFRMLRILETALIQNVKDLRSQVVREACITIAFFAQEFGSKLDHLCEIILPYLIELIPNSAKVMATSGSTCLRFIFQHTHCQRLIPIIISKLSSKSNIVRKECFYFLSLILSVWSTHELDKNSSFIQEAIAKGQTDADSEARAHARHSFKLFKKHFPEKAEALRQSLDPAKQKLLDDESLSNSSSSASISSLAARGSIGGASSTSKTPSANVRSRSTDRRLETSSSSSAVASARRYRPSDTAVKQTNVSLNKSQNIARSVSAADLGGMQKPERVPINSDANTSLALKKLSIEKRKQHSLSHRDTDPTSIEKSEAWLNYSAPVSAFRCYILNNIESLISKSVSGSEITITVRSPSPRLSVDDQVENIMNDCQLVPINNKKDNSRSIKYTLPPVNRIRRNRQIRRPSLPNEEAVSKPRKSSLTTENPKSVPVFQRTRTTKSSHSQPGSRSNSPSSQQNYLTNTNYGTTPRKSRIPRSQNTSREASPNRTPVISSGYGRERRLSNGSAKGGYQRTPGRYNRDLDNKQVEMAFSDAVRARAANRRREGVDDESETSSICSNTSYTSFGGRSDTSDRGDRRSIAKMRLRKDIAGVVANLESKNWAEKQEGLLSLQDFVLNNRTLSEREILRITDILTKLLNDQHNKVFNTLLDVLPDIARTYTINLNDWLYVLLTKLLTKAGSDLLNSVNSRLWKCLECIRDIFDLQDQFRHISKFIIDQSVTPTLRVKDAILTYLYEIVQRLDSDIIEKNFLQTDIRLAVSRIITWTSEPKSAEVRKSSCKLIVAFFDANSCAFNNLLSELPKPFREPATKVLKNFVRTVSAENRNTSSPMKRLVASSKQSFSPQNMNSSPMRPEEFYASIKQTTADIQNLNRLDAGDGNDLPKIDTASRDSGIQIHSGYNPAQYATDDLNTNNNNASSLLKSTYDEQVYDTEEELLFNDGAVRSILQSENGQRSNESTSNIKLLEIRNNSSSFKENRDQDTNALQLKGDTNEMAIILWELSNHGTRFEQRRQALLNLVGIARGNSSIQVDWDEHFKTALLLLLETVIGSEPNNGESQSENETTLRVLSLRALRQLVQRQNIRFQPYIELTVVKIIEAQCEGIHKDVTRAAEDCAAAIATTVEARHILKIISPLISTGVYPRNVAALKMLTKVIENAETSLVKAVSTDIAPILLVSYNSNESIVRKTSVMALVAMTLKIGEDTMRPFFENLSTSKLKLLNLYIKRANNGSNIGSTASSSNAVNQSEN